MKALVTIRTDSLLICEAMPAEARTTVEALLAALHYETGVYAHLRDMPSARLHIEVWPADCNLAQATLNQEARR